MSETIPKPEPPKPKPTVKSVALLAGIVVGTAAVVGLLAVGGPLVAAGGLAAAGGAGYVRHRVKNPKRGSKTWPLTGNQRSRALLPRGSSIKSGAGGKAKPSGFRGMRSPFSSQKGSTGKGKTGRRGFPLPTTRSRAIRSAGGVLPKHKGSRSVLRPTPKRVTPSAGASKPSGLRLPKTSSKSPAKLSGARRLKGGSSASRGSTRKGSRSGRGSGLMPTRLSTTRRSTPAKRSQGLKARSPFRRGTNRAGGANPFKRTSPSGKHSRRVNPFKRTTGPTGVSRRLTGGTHGRRAGQTKRARRLGTTPKLPKNRSPNRTAKRPAPYKRATARRLLRQGLGLPTRNKNGVLKRPSKAVRARSRRTLRLRGLTYAWSARKLPKMAAAAWWDRTYRRIPVPPPVFAPTVPQAKATVAPGKKYPSPTQEVRSMSVSESVTDAFAQISGFQAEGATQVEQLIIEQPEMFAQIGQHYSTLADRMVTEMPFDPAVADAMRDLAAAITAVGQLAEGVHETMRTANAADFARVEEPRPDEGMWNPERN